MLVYVIVIAYAQKQAKVQPWGWTLSEQQHVCTLYSEALPQRSYFTEMRAGAYSHLWATHNSQVNPTAGGPRCPKAKPTPDQRDATLPSYQEVPNTWTAQL